MARPRVFISSTFYDLRQIREDLERVIRELGYEPVRHEAGNIPYDKKDKLESSAYREVELCDIVVAVVGGRFGSESHEEPGYSISQKELKRALERNIQVFIFIEKNVLSEYSTYQLNKGNKKTLYSFADDIRIFEFLEQIHALPKNNPIAPFETSSDITSYLKVQWAGLFHRFLQEQKRISEMRILDEMNSTAKTLKDIVNFLTEERKSKDDAIKNILLANHPALRRYAEITNTSYRVFFSNREELRLWLKARGWSQSDSESWDEDSVEEWWHDKRNGYIKITKDIFDENDQLKIYTENDWNDSWVDFVESTPANPDDEIPF